MLLREVDFCLGFFFVRILVVNELLNGVVVFNFYFLIGFVKMLIVFWWDNLWLEELVFWIEFIWVLEFWVIKLELVIILDLCGCVLVWFLESWLIEEICWFFKGLVEMYFLLGIRRFVEMNVGIFGVFVFVGVCRMLFVIIGGGGGM